MRKSNSPARSLALTRPAQNKSTMATAMPLSSKAPADKSVASPTSVEPSTSTFMDKVKAFFSSGHADTRSEQQLEREKYIFWAPWTGRFNRFMLVLPVLITQICIGSLYSWSIFNKSMDKVWGSPGLNANAFTLAVAFFGTATGVFGSWVDRNGPFRACSITLLLSPLGWGLCAVGSKLELMGLVYFGFLLHGAGAGLAYIATCAAIQKWFAEFKGLATGLAVMGFGVGSFIWTTVGKSLMDPTGPTKWVTWQVQALFAGVFFCCLALSLPFMRVPPPGFKSSTEAYIAEQSCRGSLARVMAKKTGAGTASLDKDLTFAEAVNSVEFVLCLAFFFGVEITGIVFLSSASDMTQYVFGFDSNFANTVTSLLNLANFTGRVFWGFASDKVGRKTFYMFSAFVQAIMVGLMVPFIQYNIFGGWLASFLVVGSLYGGGFGTIPAAMSDVFGPKISAATHGLMVSTWALAAIIGIPVFGSQTAKYTTIVKGVKTPEPYAYIMNTYWLCAFPTLSFLILLFLNIRPVDRTMRMAKGDIRVRLFSHVLRINFKEGGFVLLDPAAQEKEWQEHFASTHHGHTSAFHAPGVKVTSEPADAEDVEAGHKDYSPEQKDVEEATSRTTAAAEEGAPAVPAVAAGTDGAKVTL